MSGESRETIIQRFETALVQKHGCGRYTPEDIDELESAAWDALSLLKAQGEVIDALLKVGYPHNFQREEPWIVNYMYAITDVIKKAVNLRNG